MSDIVSRPYNTADREHCCDACAFGNRYQHTCGPAVRETVTIEGYPTPLTVRAELTSRARREFGEGSD